MARAVIRGVRDLADRIPFLDVQPRNDLPGERGENEAYCRALPGRAWAVYFPDGGRVRLDVGVADAPLSLQWLDLLRARWSEGRTVGGVPLVLEAPAAGHWVALVSAPYRSWEAPRLCRRSRRSSTVPGGFGALPAVSTSAIRKARTNGWTS